MLSILFGCCWLPFVVQTELGSLVSLDQAHRLVARFAWVSLGIGTCGTATSTGGLTVILPQFTSSFATQIWHNFCWEAVIFGVCMIITADSFAPYSWSLVISVSNSSHLSKNAGENQARILSSSCPRHRSLSRDAEAQTHPLQSAWEG